MIKNMSKSLIDAVTQRHHFQLEREDRLDKIEMTKYTTLLDTSK